MPGLEVEWMRSNPCVCLELDNVTSRTDWTSVFAFGRYDELSPDSSLEGERAQQFLQLEAMWWPGAVSVTNHAARGDSLPIYYRIQIERLCGRRGVPTLVEEFGRGRLQRSG